MSSAVYAPDRGAARLAAAAALGGGACAVLHGTRQYLDLPSQGLAVFLSCGVPIGLAIALLLRTPAASPVRLAEVARPRGLWIALFAAYVLLNVPSLGTTPLFTDEAFWLEQARFILSGHFLNPVGFIGDQPANFHSWIVAASAFLTRSAPFAVRLPGVLFVAGMALQLGRLAFVLSGRVAAFFAAFFGLLCVWTVHFVSLGWMNVSITPFLVAWMLSALTEGVIHRCPRALLRSGIAVGIAVNTLYVSLVPAVFVCLAVLLAIRRIGRRAVVMFAVTVFAVASPTFGKCLAYPGLALGRHVSYAKGTEQGGTPPRYADTAAHLASNLRPEPAPDPGRRDERMPRGVMVEWSLGLVAACGTALLAWGAARGAPGALVVLGALLWCAVGLIASNPGTSEWRQSILQPFLFLAAGLAAGRLAGESRDSGDRHPGRAALAAIGALAVAHMVLFLWLRADHGRRIAARAASTEELDCQELARFARPLLEHGVGVLAPPGIAEGLLRAYSLREVPVASFEKLDGLKSLRDGLPFYALVACLPSRAEPSPSDLVARLASHRKVKALTIPVPSGPPLSLLLASSAGIIRQTRSTPERREYRGICVAPDGNLLVADFANSRILEFTPGGALVRAIGARGAGPRQFQDPTGIAADAEGNIYVADTWNSRIQILNRSGAFLRECRADFFGPRGVAVGGDGSIVVADTGRGRVLRLGNDCRVLSETTGLAGPVGVFVGSGGRIYVAETGAGALAILSSAGVRIGGFPVRGWSDGFPTEPGVFEDASGRIWATVPTYNLIRAFSPEGRIIFSSRGGAGSREEIREPMGLAVDDTRAKVWYCGLHSGPGAIPLPPASAR